MIIRTGERSDGTKFKYPISYDEYKGRELEERTIPAVVSLPSDKKTLIRTLIDGRRVYLVDGTWIRDNLDTSFTMGSHSLVDSFVPEGELWIDWHLAPKDRDMLVYHEKFENDMMNYLNMNYETAHDIANDMEKRLRNI